MNSIPDRRIAHLDMDAFFASVALLQYPQLEGLPMVIGGRRMTAPELLAEINRRHPGRTWEPEELALIPPALFPRLANYRGRGVSTTATYAARQYGLRSGMGLVRSAQLCPQAILLPVDFERYRHYSRQFKQIILSMAPVMEDRGIDEVFIDLSALPGVQEDGGLAAARQLQQRIAEGTGLSCSIGVAPNKLIAKMASEFDKPGGISIVAGHELQTRIWPLPCHKINGIGPRTDARLQALGIHRIGELAAREPAWLMQHFGRRQGQWLHDVAWGRDERPVANRGEPLSISRETTFERDLHAIHDRAELGRIFTRLAEQTAADLQRKGYRGRTIGIKLRYADFRIVTRDQSISEHVDDARTIRQVAGQCLKRVDLGPRLRLLGIRVGSLRRTDETLRAETAAWAEAAGKADEGDPAGADGPESVMAPHPAPDLRTADNGKPIAGTGPRHVSGLQAGGKRQALPDPDRSPAQGELPF